mgnify:CR=1 FL=1
MATLTIENQSKWDEVIALYSSGASDIEVSAHLKMTSAQFDRSYQDVEAFAKLIDYGRTLQKAWWYSTLRKNLTNKSFNPTLFNFAMKNLYGWADKVETTSTDGQELSADRAKAELQSIMKRLNDKDPSLLKLVVNSK